MKKNFTHISNLLTASVMLFMVSAISLMGQTPTTFQYQAVLRNADGTINADASVNIQLELHQGSETGTVVYSETHSTNTSEFGMVNLEMGSITPATFATIDWSAGPYFVEVSVNGLSMGTSELLSVPYARHAGFAESVEIVGSEAAFAGWDKNESDDFDGAFGSLSGIPADLADGDDNTQLNEGQVEAYIDGNETSFDGWDKNAADDFNGAFGSLSGTPTTLSGYGVTSVERITALNVNCVSRASVGTSYEPLTNIGSFTKENDASFVEVTFQGRVAVTGTFGGTGVHFELRIDGAATSFGRARVSLKAGEGGTDGRHVTITGFFTGISAGIHTVSMWVRSSSGTSTNLFLDPGCWTSDIVYVREYR